MTPLTSGYLVAVVPKKLDVDTYATMDWTRRQAFHDLDQLLWGDDSPQGRSIRMMQRDFDTQSLAKRLAAGTATISELTALIDAKWDRAFGNIATVAGYTAHDLCDDIVRAAQWLTTLPLSCSSVPLWRGMAWSASVQTLVYTSFTSDINSARLYARMVSGGFSGTKMVVLKVGCPVIKLPSILDHDEYLSASNLIVDHTEGDTVYVRAG